MKEAGFADESKILESFKDTRNELFVKEEKKNKGRKSTPKVQADEGSSSQPKKRRKKTVETLLVDEPDVEEPEPEAEAEDEVEAETEVNVGIDVRLSPNSEKLLKDLNDFIAQNEKETGNEEGDNGDKSSSSSSYEEIDVTERLKRIQAEVEKERQLKRKRRHEKDDDAYVPSPEYVSESQTPPAGGRKKSSAWKSVVSPRAARKKLILRLPKRTPKAKSSQPPSPPPEPSPPKSAHKSPPKQPTPPRQPSPPQSPFHLSPLHQSPPHISPPYQTPIQEQLVLTSQQIFQTPPSTQPPIQTAPSSSDYKTFPNVPTEGITLDEIGDFGFANDEQVKKLEKKVEEVVVENKRLTDREKILEMRVKKVESDNKPMLKKIEDDQNEIDVMKVKIAELE
ncbi:hypothetical protein Hanom_Chr01g00040241 [Helianthus anomalus]